MVTQDSDDCCTTQSTSLSSPIFPAALTSWNDSESSGKMAKPTRNRRDDKTVCLKWLTTPFDNSARWFSLRAMVKLTGDVLLMRC
jgi:hypothetical protein